MRLTPAAFKRGWLPAEKVEFQELLPLKLKNSVSGKGDKSSDVACVQEMSVLFACLKKNDFQQDSCVKEIDSFQKCYIDFRNQKYIRKSQSMKGALAPGSKNLNHKQLSALLSKYPS